MTTEIPEPYDDDVEEFLSEYFRPGYHHDPSGVSESEEEKIEEIVDAVGKDLDSDVGELGIALDFLMVAEQLSQRDDWLEGYNPSLTGDEVLDRYEQRDTKTLTFLLDGDMFGIRPAHNNVIEVFREDLKRTNFPSSPGHHTGNWRDYDEHLTPAFAISRPARYEAALRLFELGLEELQEKSFERRDPPFPEPFVRIVEEYERSDDDEEAGSAFQAISYGYVETEWPHLSFRASKVRTGSERQNRYGDVDGFYGPDLMVSAEVKDLLVNRHNVSSELGKMMDLAENTGTVVLAICEGVTDEARTTLEDAGVHVITEADLLEELQTWDYYKQTRAVQGMIHYFANVEENPNGVQRLLDFVEEIDPDNKALAHIIH